MGFSQSHQVLNWGYSCTSRQGSPRLLPSHLPQSLCPPSAPFPTLLAVYSCSPGSHCSVPVYHKSLLLCQGKIIAWPQQILLHRLTNLCCCCGQILIQLKILFYQLLELASFC